MWTGFRKRVQFRYCDFYDVPRLIAFEWRGSFFVIQSAFDEALDEYPDEYKVYAAPEGINSIDDSFHAIEKGTLRYLGKVPINAIGFDPTKRKTLDSKFLKTLFP